MTNIIRVRETEVGLQHLNDSEGNSDAPLFHSLKGVWLTLCCLTWTQTWTSSYPSLGDHCGYCSILSEYHLLRTKSGWNIRKKGWNADAWVAEDGRPHGTTWRVIGWWPFLTSLFLPSLFRNTGAFSLNRNSQSPLEQLDLDSKDGGDGSASHVFAISIWRSEFRAPAHISKDTEYSVSNSTLGDAVAGRSLGTLSSGSPRDPVLDNMVHHDWRWPLTSTPGLHRCLALPYTHTCIHIQINTDKNVKDEFCRHTKIIT